MLKHLKESEEVEISKMPKNYVSYKYYITFTVSNRVVLLQSNVVPSPNMNT